MSPTTRTVVHESRKNWRDFSFSGPGPRMSRGLDVRGVEEDGPYIGPSHPWTSGPFPLSVQTYLTIGRLRRVDRIDVRKWPSWIPTRFFPPRRPRRPPCPRSNGDGEWAIETKAVTWGGTSKSAKPSGASDRSEPLSLVPTSTSPVLQSLALEAGRRGLSAYGPGSRVATLQPPCRRSTTGHRSPVTGRWFASGPAPRARRGGGSVA